MNARMLFTAVALLLAAAVAVSASQLTRRSGDKPQKSTATASQANTAPSRGLPVPKGEPVVRAAGVIQGNLAAHSTIADYRTLDRLGTERVRIYEPFVKRQVVFQGMSMAKFLHSLGGVPASSKRLYMHALDDSHVDLPISDLTSNGFLATRANGKPIPVRKGGPIRLVFTSKSAIAANTDNWIWSTDRIRAHR